MARSMLALSPHTALGLFTFFNKWADGTVSKLAERVEAAAAAGECMPMQVFLPHALCRDRAATIRALKTGKWPKEVPAWIKPHLALKWADAYDAAYSEASIYGMRMLSTMFEKVHQRVQPDRAQWVRWDEALLTPARRSTTLPSRATSTPP